MRQAAKMVQKVTTEDWRESVLYCWHGKTRIGYGIGNGYVSSIVALERISI